MGQREGKLYRTHLRLDPDAVERAKQQAASEDRFWQVLVREAVSRAFSEEPPVVLAPEDIARLKQMGERQGLHWHAVARDVLHRALGEQRKVVRRATRQRPHNEPVGPAGAVQ